MKKLYLALSIIASVGLLQSAGKASDSMDADPINRTNSLHVFSNKVILVEIAKYLNDTDIVSLKATSKAVNNCFKQGVNLKILDRRYRKTGKEIKLSLYRHGDAMVWEGKTLQDAKENIREFLGLKQADIPEFIQFVVDRHARDSELKEFTGIKNIDLSECSKITDTGLACLKNATTVNLSGCEKITDAGLACLKNVTTVNLGYCYKITDAGLAHLQNATSVRIMECHQITDAGLVHLKNATKVDISFCSNITDLGLAHLQKATTVNLLGCSKITHKAIYRLLQRGVKVQH